MKRRFVSITLIKIVHTVIWFVMASAVLYILYSGISDNLNTASYGAVGLIFLETAVLLANRWACPLTIVAKKIKTDWKDGDDIFLPKWLAINNKMIFGTLFSIGLVIIIFRVLSRLGS